MATPRDPGVRRRAPYRPRRADHPARAPEPAAPAPEERVPVPDPRLEEPIATTWRDHVQGASGLNIIAGIWLIIAPFVLGYSHGDPYWNDIVFGAIVALIGLVRVSGAYRESWLSWINALIGVWIFISAFWLDNTGRAFWNDFVLGIVVFCLAAWSAIATEEGLRPRLPYRRRPPADPGAGLPPERPVR